MLNSLSLVSNHFQINENNKHFLILCFWSKIQKDRNYHKFSQFFMKKLTHFWSFFQTFFLFILTVYSIAFRLNFFIPANFAILFYVRDHWYCIKSMISDKENIFCEKGETIGNSVRSIQESSFRWHSFDWY